MNTHDYQYHINDLLTKDDTGLVSSFVLQLDSILADSELTTSTEFKLIGETIQFLHDLLDNNHGTNEAENF